MPLITVADFDDLIRDEMPFAVWLGVTTEALGEGSASLRLPYRPELLRPGGVMFGPMIMALGDFALYAAIMTVDARGKRAVTSSLNTSFLRTGPRADLVAEARVLDCGPDFAVGTITVHSAGRQDPIAHLTGSYAFPAG